MPKIIIRETVEPNSLYTGEEVVVFVPGTCDFVDESVADKNNCVLIERGKDITKIIKAGTSDDGSYLYVSSLLARGLNILYCKIAKEDLVADKVSFLKDKNAYNIRYITSGVYGNMKFTAAAKETSASFTYSTLSALVDIAKERKDCVVLADYEQLATTVKISDVYTALQTVTTSDNSYAALFSDWGVYSGKTMPPSFFYLMQAASAIDGGDKWSSVAGVKRGTIGSIYATPQHYISKYDLDNTYMQKEGISFNGFTDIRPYGYTIWGDRTLLANTGSLKATSFLSIRLLVCDLAKRVYNTAIYNTFESNSDVTWANYKTPIVELLDQMVADNKLADYRITKITPAPSATIKCKIRLVPIEPVEDFDITIDLTSGSLEE